MGVAGDPLVLSAWDGALLTEDRGAPRTSIRTLVQSYEDGTFASLALTSSRERYWVKVLGNPQGNQVLVTEAVVAGVGRLIEAPVRPTALVEIPRALEGVSYGPALYGVSHRLHAGCAHGSLHLDNAEEKDSVAYERRGDNARRRAALAALWDWCLGDDEQWLYDQADNYAMWSFDHGHWLGGGSGEWDADVLRDVAAMPWTWDSGLSGTNLDELDYCARKLERVTAGEILSVLAGVPTTWETPDSDLEALGWFLYTRRLDVAKRLDSYIDQVHNKRRGK